MRSFAIGFAVSCFALLTLAQNSPVVGLNSLTEVEFSALSQTDPNPLGEKALAIHPEQWKHAETDHFIYHFVHSYVATPISVEAEFHYRVIAKELERDQPPGDVKSHIYIFEQPQAWQAFQIFGHLEPWTGGIHSAGSLFIQRNPAFRFGNNALGHEIVHLVLHRFYTDSIPRWLDEGLAQFISKDAHASYERARGYLAKPHSDPIAPNDYIPVATLTTMSYPAQNRVKTFYDESERFVRFLATTDKSNFLTLLDALARHQPFESAVMQLYAGRFSSLPALEDKFREYSSQDLATAIQQATSN